MLRQLRLLPPEYLGPQYPPDSVLADLRAIDDKAELVCISEGRWWLGTVRPNERRRKHGEFMLAKYKLAGPSRVNPARMLRALLIQQGFAFVAEYEVSTPDSRIVNDFRMRKWRLQHEAEEAEKERVAEATGAEKHEALDKKIATDGIGEMLEGYDFADAQPVSVIKPEMAKSILQGTAGAGATTNE